MRGGAVLAAAGLLMSGAVPAFSAAKPTISIAAKSAFRPVTGDVFVPYHAGKFSKAQISGSVTGAISGEVVRLLAQPFPYKKPATRVQVQSLTATGTDRYSFTVTPQLTTRYTVMLFASATATGPIAWSGRKPVYLTTGGSTNAPQRCKRPVCHETFHLRIVAPAATVAREEAKHWYVYFADRLTTTPGKVPAPPTVLKLDTRATVSKAKKVSADTFRLTLSFSFRIGNDGYSWNWTACTKDVEAKDGLGLPGHHSCGNKQVSTKLTYLG